MADTDALVDNPGMDKSRRVVRIAVIALGFAVAAIPGAGCRDRTVEVSLDKAIDHRDLKTGIGSAAKEGNLVEVHYVATLPDGTVVLDTRQRKPHKFIVGDGTVIPGMDSGVRGMRGGGVRILTLPPHAHYGRMGYANIIPEDTVLTFEIEMIRVSSGGASPVTWAAPEGPG